MRRPTVCGAGQIGSSAGLQFTGGAQDGFGPEIGVVSQVFHPLVIVLPMQDKCETNAQQVPNPGLHCLPAAEIDRAPDWPVLRSGAGRPFHFEGSLSSHSAISAWPRSRAKSAGVLP